MLDKAAAESLEVSPRDAFAPVFVPLRKAQPKIGQRDPPSLPNERVDQQSETATERCEEKKRQKMGQPEKKYRDTGHARACRTTRATSSICCSVSSGYIGSESTWSAAVSAARKLAPALSAA